MTRPAPEALCAWAAGALGREYPLVPLAGDAGSRRYFRVQGSGFLAMFGPDAAENRAWLAMSRHLLKKDLPLPDIRAYDRELGFFLLADLGDGHLSKILENGLTWEARDAYTQTIEIMAKLHRRGAEGFQQSWCHQEPVYNAAMIFEKEVLYFLQNFEVDAELYEEALRFSRAVEREAPPAVLIHRDFQSRNVLLTRGGPFLIDYQGARLGPGAYDLASLLNDPYTDIPQNWRDDFISLYLSAAGREDEEKFRRELLFTGAARLMQNLGAYAKLCREGKDFARWIPPAAERLVQHFNNPLLHGWPRLTASAREYFLRADMRPE